MQNELKSINQKSSNKILATTSNLKSFSQTPEEMIWLRNITSAYTKQTYKDSVVSFCKFFNIQNAQEFKEVQAIHIIEYRDSLVEAGFKKSTINNRLAALSSLFKHLIERQEVKLNPVYGVTRMKKDYTKVQSRALSDMEVKAMMDQIDESTIAGLRDKAILSIMFNLGTRVGTIAKLRGKDIYEENGYLVFDMYIKGDRRNKVAVNSHIQASLKNYFTKLGYYKTNINGNSNFEIADDVILFPNMSNNSKFYSKTTSIDTRAIRYIWHKYANLAGLKRTNPHCARATFITKAFAVGCDLQFIQATAGHNDPRTTKSYDHNEVEYKNSASLKVSFG
jgi:site-specific recombinase XerD